MSSYSYDLAGNTTAIGELELDYDQTGRLFRIDPGVNFPRTRMRYDGRDFLVGSVFVPDGPDTLVNRVTYGSEGRYYSSFVEPAVGPVKHQYVAYFGERPVAIFTGVGDGGQLIDTELTYLTTDHLGTPVLSTDELGAIVWQGGFEPFGADWSSAQEAEVFLRFPGQWENETWENETWSTGLYYNVHRWYEHGTGRYTRADPLTSDLAERATLLGLAPYHVYAYGDGNPITRLDPLGLQVELCQRPNQIPEFQGVPVLESLPHQWLKTPTKEAGLGPAQGGVPGNQLPACRCQKTAINDHTGESGVSGATCRVLEDVDEACVNEKLTIGRPQGPWVPLFNDCWTFVHRVIAECRTSQPHPFLPPKGSPGRMY